HPAFQQPDVRVRLAVLVPGLLTDRPEVGVPAERLLIRPAYAPPQRQGAEEWRRVEILGRRHAHPAERVESRQVPVVAVAIEHRPSPPEGGAVFLPVAPPRAERRGSGGSEPPLDRGRDSVERLADRSEPPARVLLREEPVEGRRGEHRVLAERG